MSDIEWTDPPAPAPQAEGGKWTRRALEIVPVLREHPGRWAVWVTDSDRTYGYALARRVRDGKPQAFASGNFEGRFIKNPKNDSRGQVVVRYVGEPGELS